MGFATRRPILPAPTDSLIDSTDETGIGTEVATDLSKQSERSHHTIPEDGRSITINTAKTSKSKLSKLGNHSQTSLLIEYFESSTEPNRRPSVRVRVRPSTSKKSKDKNKGHILVTEAEGPRRPSQTHRIALGRSSGDHIIQDSNISSLDSEAEAIRGGAPVEIDVTHRDESELSASPEARYIIPESDISSMPADSMLGISKPDTMAETSRESNRIEEFETLKPPMVPTERNQSREHITQKVIEKLSNKPRTSVESRTRTDKSRHRGSLERNAEVISSGTRRRSGKKLDEDSYPSATASSLVSGSLLSADTNPADQRSVRSGTSNVSIQNPKLLQTVEDAIRRLILPELKELKDNRHASHRSKYDREVVSSDFSESTTSREDGARRRSSGKSRRRVSKEGETTSSRKREHHRRKDIDYDTPSERGYRHSDSIDSASIEEDYKSRKHGKDRRVKDAAAGALAGAAAVGLTAAALKHHDSGSGSELRRERRKKRSKSRSSRSTSVSRTEDLFNRHDVPPMPMRSEVDSELTRSSLLSSNTAGTATPIHREVREVIRGSPRAFGSSPAHTSNGSGDLKKGLGTHHENFSEPHLAGHTAEEEYDDEYYDEVHEKPYHGFNSEAFATHGLIDDPERVKAYERNLHQQHPIRRGLSPIQSVASYATTEPNRTSLIQARSIESLSSLGKGKNLKEVLSSTSISPESSPEAQAYLRPQGFSLENRSEIMAPHKISPDGRTRGLGDEQQYNDQSLDREVHRDSFTSDDHRVPIHRTSRYTDESADTPYIDKVTAGQRVAQGYAANPQYVSSPAGVESAVASLYEPSLLDIQAQQSPRYSHTGSPYQSDVSSVKSMAREFEARQNGSPLKQQLSSPRPDTAIKTVQPEVVSSPPTIVRSTDAMGVLPTQSKTIDGTRTTEAQELPSPESEITTNPSDIQGPIGGTSDHWQYDPSPRSRDNVILSPKNRELAMAAAELVPEALSISRDPNHDSKTNGFATEPNTISPPGGKDEGYETGANLRSPGPYEYSKMPPGKFTPTMELEDPEAMEDPFTTKDRQQYVSGLSHGMSPMYDSATGRGIEHIKSNDIVALMNHLTVRDAQRNARDTEILVALVQTAAEMRNSFDDMKDLVSQQGKDIIDSAEKQHEKTQRIVGSTRSPPTMSQYNPRSMTIEDDESRSRRSNPLKRIFGGLSSKNTSDIQHIETIMLQLLHEVEGLKAMHGTGARGPNEHQIPAFNSVDNVRQPTDAGYEPEGQAGTSSTGDRSGFFSNNSSRQANYRSYDRRESGNRVSTVMEGDEEYDDYNDGVPRDQNDLQLTPRATPTNERKYQTQDTQPITPTRANNYAMGQQSNEHTPHQSTEGTTRSKTKSFASSFIPKVVSRWSKTTASSAGDNFRGSTQTKTRPYSQQSQSGSELEDFDYDPHGEDRLRSNTSLQADQYRHDENRPPSPLVPSQVSDNPKYQAHRNSMNLQHPQPRQGPTGRYQYQLESEAQHYVNDSFSPTSQTSSQWENSGFNNIDRGVPPAEPYTHGGHLSPIADRYSETSSAMMGLDNGHDGRSIRSTSSTREAGPPRPPKIAEDPLVPQRPPKIMMSPSGSRQPTYVDHVTAARAGSPAFDKSPVAALRSSPGQTRKPSGPRPLSTSGTYKIGGPRNDPNTIKKTRFRGSPNQIDSDDDISYP